MKEKELFGAQRHMAFCFLIVAVSIFAGILASFRFAGSFFAEGAELVSGLSTADVGFLECLRKALLSDGAFCLAIVVFASAFPACILPGAVLLFETFSLGAAAGLIAKTFVAKEAAGMLFAIFVSNFLVLPLKILLFLASLNFSLRTATLGVHDKLKELFAFVLKALLFYALMFISECIQLAIGIAVL